MAGFEVIPEVLYKLKNAFASHAGTRGQTQECIEVQIA
jgi:hypothetical protein